MLERLKSLFAHKLATVDAVLVGSCAIGLGCMIVTINLMNRNYYYQSQINQANLDNQLIELQNENLQLEQAYYKTDEYLELSARALLGKAKPGENLVLIKQDNSINVQANKTSAKEERRSNLEHWIDFLSGKR